MYIPIFLLLFLETYKGTMASKRRPIHTTNSDPSMKYRPAGLDPSKNETKGTRPTAKPSTVNEVLTQMILHVCKKTIFFDTNLKVALYLGALFLISLIGDYAPFPKTYFARSDNLFNQYFVKLGWAWTLLLGTPFVCMTSYTLCCGDVKKIVRNHLPRIIIATIFWFSWTKTFNIIESSFGRCTVRSFPTKSGCLKKGHLWNGFDISGHAFILIYSSLVLIEEARPIINWDYIREHLRNEQHNRQVADLQHSNPLKNLKDHEFLNLKFLYGKFTPMIRINFIAMTVLQLLWDCMLVGTMLYYHNMAEKFVSGAIAILTWFFTYRFWYPSLDLLPDVAGKGVFLYQKNSRSEPIPLRRNPSLVNNNLNGARSTTGPQGPKFMGMPLNTGGYAKQQSQQQQQNNDMPSSSFNAAFPNVDPMMGGGSSSKF